MNSRKIGPSKIIDDVYRTEIRSCDNQIHPSTYSLGDPFCHNDENRCENHNSSAYTRCLHHTFMTWFALTFAVYQNADFTAQPSITIEDDDGPTPNEEIQTETGVKPGQLNL